jgi:hypothetical protein
VEEGLVDGVGWGVGEEEVAGEVGQEEVGDSLDGLGRGYAGVGLPSGGGVGFGYELAEGERDRCGGGEE